MSFQTVDLEVEARKLAAIAELPPEQVLGEMIAMTEKEGLSPFIAVIAWKARNSLMLGANKVDIVARVICKERPKATKSGSRVASVHFAVEDAETGEVVFKTSALWDDRIEKLWAVFEEDKALRFSASIDKSGKIQRISKIEELPEPNEIATLALFEPISLDDLASFTERNEVIEGWVARNNDGGLDVGTLETTLPVRVWYAGEYSKMLPEKVVEAEKLAVGDHVKAFGYITPGLSMNAIRIVKV